MTHYDELGVRPDADNAEIKRAYRRAAQKHHPDRAGGSTEKFQAAKKAYEVLSDRTARAKYDSTGDDSQNDPDRQARLKVIALFMSILDKVDEVHVDLIEIMRAQITKDETEDRAQVAHLQRSIAKRERILKRISKRQQDGQINLLAQALEWDIAERKKRIEIGMAQIEEYALLRAVLNEYTYRTDALLAFSKEGSVNHWRMK